MAQWGKADQANNSVKWAAQSLSKGSGKAARAANNTALFGNNTADAFITGKTIGQFGVSVEEAQANPAIPHAGWVLKSTGSGGRAGRVTYEVLVAGGFINSDASDDADIADYILSFTSQPANDSANGTAEETASFTVVAASKPSGATITYKWQANTGSGFSNVSDGAVYSNTATATLSVDDVTGLDGAQYRVVITAGGASNTSAAATLTVTS